MTALFTKENPEARLSFRLRVRRSELLLDDILCKPAQLTLANRDFKGYLFRRDHNEPRLDFTLDCRDLEPGVPIDVKLSFTVRGRQKRLVRNLEITPQLMPRLELSHESEFQILEGKTYSDLPIPRKICFC